jgi:hypothetical protein
MRSGWQPQLEAAADPNAPRPPDRLGLTNRERPGENRGVQLCMWACGAAGSALPWHGRGHRFDPDQVHQISHVLTYICRHLRCAPSLFLEGAQRC